MNRSKTFEPERSKLKFVESAQAIFKFLKDEYGFSLVKVEPPTFVRYESKNVFVNVFHGRLSYELGVEIGLINCSEFPSLNNVPNSLFDMLGYLGIREGSGYFKPSVRTASLVREFLYKQAEFVRKYLDKALKGDIDVYQKFLSESEKRATKYENGMLRHSAEEAWNEKRYHDTVKFYESIQGNLTDIEQKRLSYARNKCCSRKVDI